MTDKDITILVVEDYELFIKPILQILQSWGFTNIEVAVNPDEAIEVVTTQEVNLVISDFRRIALELLKKMREHDKLDNIPVIVMSAISSSEVEEYEKVVKAAGASGFIVKSEIYTDLKPLIEKLLS